MSKNNSFDEPFASKGREKVLKVNCDNQRTEVDRLLMSDDLEYGKVYNLNQPVLCLGCNSYMEGQCVVLYKGIKR